MVSGRRRSQHFAVTQDPAARSEHPGLIDGRIFRIPVNGELIVSSGGILESSNGSGSTKRLEVQFDVASDISVDGRVGRDADSRLRLVSLAGSVTVTGTHFPGAWLEISAGRDVNITSNLTLESLTIKNVGGDVTAGAITATGRGDAGWIVIERINGNVTTGALTDTNTGGDDSFVVVSRVGGSVVTGDLTATGGEVQTILGGIGGSVTAGNLAARGVEDALMFLGPFGSSVRVGALTATAFDDAVGFGWISFFNASGAAGVTTGAVTAIGGWGGIIEMGGMDGNLTTGAMNATGSVLGYTDLRDVEGSVTTDAITAKGREYRFVNIQARGDLLSLAK